MTRARLGKAGMRIFFAKTALSAAAVALLVAGCATSGYYLQAAEGQWELWRLARPLAEAQEDAQLPALVRERLAAAAAIRDFASRQLALPDNGSYRRYAELRRPYVVWNVFAAEPLSIEPKQWCFPIAGCVGYRGYFAAHAARAYASRLQEEGYEVHVSGVPAYSTLGWFDDPLLSTFIHYPETELARLIFHELSHQIVYVRDDTEFNESFAVAVEEEGVRRWLDLFGSDTQRSAFARAQSMRSDFGSLVSRYRERLGALYGEDIQAAEKLARKAAILAELRDEYERMKRERWGGFSGYDRWLGEDINNATLASIGLYSGMVPAFAALLAREGGALPAFYATVRSLAGLRRDERRRKLVELAADAFPPAANFGMLSEPIVTTDRSAPLTASSGQQD